jgi:DNA-binding response OmpR family regulator
MKILVVEDDLCYRAVLFEYLHLRGHDVMVVSDAVHAVALLIEENHGIELVLLDLVMPRLNGDKLLETFAAWNGCTTRFVVISGSAKADLHAQHPRVAAVLQKPFSIGDLDEIIGYESARRERFIPLSKAG